MMKSIWLLIVCLTLFSSPVTWAEEPLDQDECLAQGGEWGVFGLLMQEQCNLPTSDAGKSCADSKECKGACIAELTTEERVKVASGVPIQTMGKCTESTLNFGCHPFVRDGQVKGILCVD